MRLIDADETIRRLHEYLSKIEDRYQNADTEFWRDRYMVTMDVIRACMEYVRYTPTADRWIPVSEDLPKEDGRYLCDWQGMRVGTCYFHNGHFRVYGDIKDKYVTAWMELPKPYGVEEE